MPAAPCPRIPSSPIAAYRADLELIRGRWANYRERSRRAALEAVGVEPEPDPPGDYSHARYWADIEGCEARHFGNPDPREGLGLNTPACLWRWLERRLDRWRTPLDWSLYGGWGSPHARWDD